MNAHAPITERITPVAARLSPLLGKLGSPHDAEVLSAARALGRQLERKGLGFNDLGAALAIGPVVRVVYAEPEPAEDWRGMAEWLAARLDLLTLREAAFIRTMCQVLRRPGAEPTTKQAKWLAAIYDRLTEDAAWWRATRKDRPSRPCRRGRWPMSG